MNAVMVVDCSVAMAWLFSDEATPQTAALLNRLEVEPAVVPGWWFLEIVNVIAIAERKGRITSADAAEFIHEVLEMAIDIDIESPSRAFDYLLPLCRVHRLTSYDAMYLDLAIRRQLPLATLDEELRAAATSVGVALLGK